MPTNLNTVHLNPLRGTALFVFAPSPVFIAVDNLFGGDGRFPTKVEGREFTPTEQRVIKRMLRRRWTPTATPERHLQDRRRVRARRNAGEVHQHHHLAERHRGHHAVPWRSAR